MPSAARHRPLPHHAARPTARQATPAIRHSLAVAASAAVAVEEADNTIINLKQKEYEDNYEDDDNSTAVCDDVVGNSTGFYQ